MATRPAPQEIVELAETRATARRNRDWSTADEARARIEAAGWRVVDTGTLYDLVPAAPADVVDDHGPRYGSSASVPSRLLDAPTGLASVILVATDWPADVQRAVGALRSTSPAGTQLVVVANGPSEDQDAALVGLAGDDAVEVVRMVERVGHATALNAGLRRAAAAVVILLDASVEPHGDMVTPIVDALADDSVAVAGPFGVVSDDMRHFRAPLEGAVDVDVIEVCALGFRRQDYLARGPLDEHFVVPPSLDTWWSLVLRDQPDDADDGTRPRRAVQTAGARIDRHEDRTGTTLPPAERERLAKRNHYRVLKRFATRRDLLVGSHG